MIRKLFCVLLTMLMMAAAATAAPKFGSVASVNPLASEAALRTLREGGNAIDAAVAAMLTLGVVDGHNSGIGGGCFVLVRLADGRTVAIDGRETAPAAATRDMYIRDGKPDPALSQVGPLAVATPGALMAYDAAVSEMGTMKLADLLVPAAKLADDGFPIDRIYAGKLQREQTSLVLFDASRKTFLKPDRTPYTEGEFIRQPELAATYRAIGRSGIEWFYKGEFARRVDEWMHANGGVLTADDLAGYQIVRREPIVSSYRQHTIIGMPPPSSGGLHVAQMLTMLERFDLAGMNDADRLTTLANSMQVAFADRAFWLGDPDFAKVPTALLDAEYLKTRSQLIRSDAAVHIESHGQPATRSPTFGKLDSPSPDSPAGSTEKKHTTHVCVADAAGNVVAITATVNTSFGSKIVVPGTGVVLNNQMDDFSAQPGAANYFGLIGAENNAIQPGKRPLSSMSPTIVLRNDKPAYVIGAAGGPRIISQVVCVLSNLIDRKLPPAQAMTEPRVHHQWRPESLWIENTLSPELRAELTRRGFKLDEVEPSGATNLIAFEGENQTPVSEPRLPGRGIAE